MELKLLDRILLKALYLVVAGIVVCEVLDIQITSTLFLFTFPLTVALWIRTVRQKVTGLDFAALTAIALAFISVLINASITNTDIDFDYLKKVIMFSMSLLFLQTCYKIKVKKDMVVFINRLVDCLTILLIVAFFIWNSQMHMIDNRVSAYLTFRFSNPNLTGLFLVCLYMLELYRLFSREKWGWKLLHIAMAAFLGYFILESQSRNSLLAFVAFTAICAWLIFKSRRQLRITKFGATVFSIAPALFVMFYMVMVNLPWVQLILDFLVGEGKALTSRHDVWETALTALYSSPLIGAYSQISNGEGASQMHNSHLDIAASYGIIVFLLVCYLLWRYLYQKGRYYNHKSNYVYILGFVCAILLGIGEAALFSGGLGIYVFIGTFLMLANYEKQESIG